ncbi:MAG: hypothetical protein ACTHLW_15025, partial [Verrucomicrobiota bacterium]
HPGHDPLRDQQAGLQNEINDQNDCVKHRNEQKQKRSKNQCQDCCALFQHSDSLGYGPEKNSGPRLYFEIPQPREARRETDKKLRLCGNKHPQFQRARTVTDIGLPGKFISEFF